MPKQVGNRNSKKYCDKLLIVIKYFAPAPAVPGRAFCCPQSRHCLSGVAEYRCCDEHVCLCVCLSVCPSASISSELHLRSSTNFLHVTDGRGPVLRRPCNTLCISVLMGNVIVHIMCRNGGMSITLQRVTSLHRRAQANAPAASYWLRRVLEDGWRRDWTEFVMQWVPGAESAMYSTHLFVGIGTPQKSSPPKNGCQIVCSKSFFLPRQ